MAMHADPYSIIKDHEHLIPQKDHKFLNSLMDCWQKGWCSPSQKHWLSAFADEVIKAQTGTAPAPHMQHQGVLGLEAPPVPPSSVNVGDFSGVVSLFKEVAKKLKSPQIVLTLPNGRPLHLKLAGPQSKTPGVVNVTDGRPFGQNKWYGRVHTNGTWNPSKDMLPETMVPITRLLKALSCDPVNTAAEHGRLTGRCCFCDTELTDDKSLAVGYGPVCAARWNLPWGARKAKPV